MTITVIERFDNEVGKGNKQAVEWLSIAAERGNYHALIGVAPSCG